MFKSYADRPATPLGTATGLTSTPCSQHPSRCGTPKQMFNPYQYQPAVMWNHPGCYSASSSNYLNALRNRVVARVAETADLRKEVECLCASVNNDVDGKSEVKNMVFVVELTDLGTNQGNDEHE